MVFGVCVCIVWVCGRKRMKKNVFFPFCDSYLLSDVDPGVMMLTHE